MMNRAIIPSAYSIGVRMTMLPFQSVATQFRTLIPVGMATRYVAIMKYVLRPVARPTVNMWCAHTSIEMNAMPRLEKATAR